MIKRYDALIRYFDKNGKGYFQLKDIPRKMCFASVVDKEIDRLRKALKDIRLFSKSPMGLGEAWLKAVEIIEEALKDK